jgi:hypothetical protein
MFVLQQRGMSARNLSGKGTPRQETGEYGAPQRAENWCLADGNEWRILPNCGCIALR